MLFSEIYSAYFNAVAEIILKAQKGGITEREITKIANEKAFGESFLTILPAIKNQEWLLINEEGKTPIKNPPKMPLSHLQKRWLKTLLYDPRIALFEPDVSGLEEIEPLFSADDIVYFDRYLDKDPYTDEKYIENFRTVLAALREKRQIARVCGEISP